MREWYNPDKAITYTHKGGHGIPTKNEDLKIYEDFINNNYKINDIWIFNFEIFLKTAKFLLKSFF